jgi:ATP/maltotriose-dependent transcriptional regulator MalT
VVFGPAPVEEGIVIAREVVEHYGERRPFTTATAFRAWACLEAFAGRFDEARSLLERDRALIAELGVRAFRVHTAEVACWIELRAGDSAAAEAAAREGLAASEELDDPSIWAEFGALLARALDRAGRDDEVFELTDRVAERVQRGDVAVEVHRRIARAPALARAGETEAAAALAGEAVAIAKTTDFLPLLADALACLGSLTGDDAVLAEARATYARKGDIAGAAQIPRKTGLYARPRAR